MYLVFFFVLPIVLIIIPGILNQSPGDPFPVDLDDVDQETASPSVHTTPINSKSIPEDVSIDAAVQTNTDGMSVLSSTANPVQDTLRIDKKYLVQIAQWKYTDPKTHQNRYWYHTADSPMGTGWTLDGILCQVYLRQKPDTVPIQAFHSERKGLWTNTLQMETSPLPIGNNQWKYDGTPFYAYNSSMNSTLLKPVWRFWNRIKQGTEDVSEPRRSYLRMGDMVEDDLPQWRLDRLLFYAFSPNINITHVKN